MTAHDITHVEMDCMCKRCGSSLRWEECDACGGLGLSHHDCGEDVCPCAEPWENIRCDQCDGAGGWGICHSSPEWCEMHPRPGFEHIERSTVEWFDV